MSRLQIELSPYLQSVIDEVASASGKSKTATLERLLYNIELIAKNGKLPKTIGLDFIEASALQNARGRGAKHLDPVHQAGGEHVAFDVSMLEKSGKSKTGFAGVNATSGSSFRALVPDVEQGGTRYLASRPTALQAAIDRYEHFKKHNIPYGNLGWHMSDLKAKHPEWTELQCLERLEMMIPDAHLLKNPFLPEDVHRALSRYRKPEDAPNDVEPETTEAVPEALPASTERAARKPLAVVPDVVRCVFCQEEIEAGEPFGPHGKTDYAHAACVH